MKTKAPEKFAPQMSHAAQNARLGLINVIDLSLLTGVDAAVLNKFAKTGVMSHYGEYHGKRFFNFQEIVNWVSTPGEENEAKPIIRSGMENLLDQKDCPYTLEKSSPQNIAIIWKD